MRVRPYRNRSKTGRVRVPDAKGEMHTIFDETGKSFGELFVVRFLRVNELREAVFLCTCSCGKYTEVAGISLRARNCTNTLSCGHRQIAFASQRGEAHPAFKHGAATIAALATSTYWQTHYKNIFAQKQVAMGGQ